ncbi:MAG: hypothetical protein KTR32_14170 [Granulosicoccus sp.]|nr:hypothetical protein [Granulosicoccus sp.]
MRVQDKGATDFASEARVKPNTGAAAERRSWASAVSDAHTLLWSLSSPAEKQQLIAEQQLHDLLSARLGPLAQSEQGFNDLLQISFGQVSNVGAANEVRTAILNGDMQSMPRIELVDSAELQGALGAYSDATDTIFLDREIVGTELGQQTLLEELGHAIDSRINSVDSEGDEGELFRLNVQGDAVSSSELRRIRAENDTGSLMIDGRSVAVEFRRTEGYTGSDYPWNPGGVASGSSANTATTQRSTPTPGPTSGTGYTGSDYPWNPGGVASGSSVNTATTQRSTPAPEPTSGTGYTGSDYPWNPGGVASGSSVNTVTTQRSTPAPEPTSEAGYTGSDYPWNPGGVAMGSGLPDPVPDMTARRALIIVNNNFTTVDGASVDGATDGVASTQDLEHISNNSDDFEPDLVEASDYLIAHPEVFGIMEVMQDGDRVDVIRGEQTTTDSKFNRNDVNTFLAAQVHVGVIYDNADAIDTSRTGGEPDGTLSEEDFETVATEKDSDGNYVYSAQLRDAAQFVLDNDRVFDVLDSAAPRGSAPGVSLNASAVTNTVNNKIETEELHHAVIQMQVFADDPDKARQFIQDGSAVIEGLDVSDERSVSDEGMRALVNAALDGTSNTEKIEIISALPETNRGLRNELITATYADLGLKLDDFLGDESGANWAIWGVPASTKVGEVIANEQIIEVLGSNNGATGKQRALMAEGNLLLFTELAPHLNSFYETFANDQQPDQAKLDEYLSQFGPEQQGIADGLETYYEARFTDDTKEKQELTLLGNYHLVNHEQTKIDPILDDVLAELPLYADAFNLVTGNLGSDRANAAIVVEYPGRGATSVENNVPEHSSELEAYENRLVVFDNIENPEIRRILETSAAANEGRPDSLTNSYADDWHELGERMFYIYQDWRLHHTDYGLFDMAQASGFDSVDLS